MSDEDEDPTTPPAKKPKAPPQKSKVAQKFREAWLHMSEFKSWLQKHPSDEFKARCRICSKDLTADSSVLKKHSESNKHIENVNSVKSTNPKVTSFFTRSHQQPSPLDEAVKAAEIGIVGFLTEHNIPFKALDHLTDLLKHLIFDSKIVEQMALKRTKGRAIAMNVIGASAKDKIKEKLKVIKFSILSDESTDISTKKCSCIMVRFFDPEIGRIATKFWNICEVLVPGKVTSATAERIYECIMKSFDDYQIPRANIIGFGSDGCSVMMGKRNSVVTRLQAEQPGLTVSKCICHSLHICASCGCEELTRTIENLARNVNYFFTSSCKRQAEFVEFQMFCETEIHKLLHPSQTRWLSLVAVVERLLDQWPALQLYFTEKRLTSKLIIAETIHKELSDPFTKLYFYFLKWILPKFTRANQYFQSHKVVITDVYPVMKQLYIDLLSTYMNKRYIDSTDLAKIDPKKDTEYLPLENIYLGVDVMDEVQKFPEEHSQEYIRCLMYFRERCREFLIRASVEVKARFDFDDPLLQTISILKPRVALSSKTREKMPCLRDLMLLVPRSCDRKEFQMIDDEWRKLPDHDFKHEIKDAAEMKKEMESLETDVFWGRLFELKEDGSDEYVFRNVSRFALNLLSIPHANADCERVFSKVNLAKTKTRNRLVTLTMNGILLSSQEMRDAGGCCKFKPSRDMLSRMTKKSLWAHQQPAFDSSKETEVSVLLEGGDDDDEIIFDSET